MKIKLARRDVSLHHKSCLYNFEPIIWPEVKIPEKHINMDTITINLINILSNIIKIDLDCGVIKILFYEIISSYEKMTTTNGHNSQLFQYIFYNLYICGLENFRNITLHWKALVEFAVKDFIAFNAFYLTYISSNLFTLNELKEYLNDLLIKYRKNKKYVKKHEGKQYYIYKINRDNIRKIKKILQDI